MTGRPTSGDRELYRLLCDVDNTARHRAYGEPPRLQVEVWEWASSPREAETMALAELAQDPSATCVREVAW